MSRPIHREPNPPAQAKRRRARAAALVGDTGQALVEFVLVLPLVLLILFGIAYAGIAVNGWIDETSLAYMGARYAGLNQTCIVKGTPTRCPPGVSEQDTFLKWLTEHGDSTFVKSATATMCSPTSGLHDYVEIKLAFKYKWLPVIKLKAAESLVTDSKKYPIEQQPSTPYPSTC
jgi:hypothetical protein